MNVGRMRATDYLGKTVDCSCGRSHTVGINTIEISAGALGQVGRILREDGFSKPFIVSDYNTHKAAGAELLTLLAKDGIAFSCYMLEDRQLVPDEYAMGRILMNFDPDCDLIIGVGGGTINDSCRFMSNRLKLPYYIVATAPSMDGYASTGAPLIMNKFKVNFDCDVPRAIIADLDVISKAPQTMVAAGFGDMVGEYSCLADWQLSAIINGEYYCDLVVEIVRQSLDKMVAARDGIAKGEPDAIAELMEALVLSGIAMSYVGHSRPASGSEHRLSHFWEIRQLLEGKTGLLHGTKVGIATVLMADLYQRLAAEGLDGQAISQIARPSTANWENEIKEVFREAAPEVLQLEEEVQKNSVANWTKRMKVMAERWPKIQEVLEGVPSACQVAELIRGVGGVADPTEVGIDRDLVSEAIIYAKEVRSRYTVLQLAWDLGLLADYAREMAGQ